MKKRTRFLNLPLILALALGAGMFPLQGASANSVVQSLPFSQNWSNAGLIIGIDNWENVPGVVGYLGNYSPSSPIDVDPQTLLADYSGTNVDVIPNLSDVAITNGGVGEFDGLANPVVALQGSNSADAPFLLINVQTVGMTNIRVSYNVRDIDPTLDDVAQQVALHYRVGGSGDFTNVPAAYLADATIGGSIKTTPVSVVLPVAAENQALVQLRIITSNAGGNDEWVGIDDLSVTGDTTGDPAPTVIAVTPAAGASGVVPSANIEITFSEPVTAAAGFFTISCAGSGAHAATATSNDSIAYTIDPALDFGSSEQCTVTLENTLVTDLGGSAQPMAADYVWSFTTAVEACGDSYTPIYAIQGSGAAAAITGTVVTQGVVVGDYEGASPALGGYYIQDPTGDGDPATSDGIFVYNGSNDAVSLGDLVRVTGSAAEYQGQTQISTPTESLLCASGETLAPAEVTLPFASLADLERYEGMLVRLPQTLYVTEHYLLGRFGQVTLSAGARLWQPTQVAAPGADALALQAANDLNRILLDDELNVQNRDPIVFGRGGQPLSAANTLRGGDSASGIVGVLTYTWGGNSASPVAYRVRPIHALGGGAPDFQPTNPRPTGAPEVGGTLQVTALNTLNYFNTFSGCTLGVGGATTDCRGADSLLEFNRQWPKIVEAILSSGAEVIGLVEIENDGYGSASAIQHLVDRLNAVAGPGAYAFIDADARTGQTNALGTDAIKVGLVYRTAAVAPVGDTAVLNTPAFVTGGDGANRNRPALAQAFEEIASGERFVVSVNHLKSKGSACDAADSGDGQGNCNAVRAAAAGLLAEWLASDPTGTGETDVLILGDLNAYAREDPIAVLGDAGYTNLISDFGGASTYSYAFDGQWGSLDHALATASLATQVTGAAVFHINADEPAVLDYNTEYKTSGQLVSLYNADAFRASDHDPLVIGLNLGSDTSRLYLPLVAR